MRRLPPLLLLLVCIYLKTFEKDLLMPTALGGKKKTPLPTGVRSWLEVMRAPFFDQFGDRREEAYARVETALKPALCDVEGQWIADYVRLRFRAQLL